MVQEEPQEEGLIVTSANQSAAVESPSPVLEVIAESTPPAYNTRARLVPVTIKQEAINAAIEETAC